jgi:hypothetical protein
MVFKAILFFVSHYAFIVWIGILSYGIGRRLTQQTHFSGKAEQFSFCMTLGLGILAYLVFLIGILGVLHHLLVLVVIGIIFLLCSSAWIELFQAISAYFRQKGIKWRSILFSFLIVLCLLPILLMPLYPPTAFDSTMYHLTYAKIYSQSHEIILTPYLRFPVFPQTNEMLFTLALLLYDGIAAQLIQFLMMVALGIGLFAFAKRHFSKTVGIWSLAIFLSNPLVLYLGTSANIDIGLTLFITMGIYVLFNYVYSKEKIWLILGALFLGFAAGSKYSALFFFALLSLVVFCTSLKDGRIFPFILFVVIAIGTAFPWYFRNWHYMGNPVFPFFGQIFGYGLWSAQDLQGALDNLLRTFGTGKSLRSLLLLPWDLTFNQSKFLMEAPYSPIYLFSLPLLFLSLSSAKIKGLWCIIFLYTLFWFWTAQVLRYLLPIIPLLSLTITGSLENCLRLFTSGKLKWVKKKFVTFSIPIILFSPGWLYVTYMVWKESFPPYTNKQQEVYLTQKLPSFPAYQYLNQTKGRNYSLYALFDENMSYFADGLFMGDWFGPARFENIYSRFSNDQGLHRELRRLGADYFLIRRNRIKMTLPKEGDLPPSLIKLVFKNDYALLFEVLLIEERTTS